MNILDELQPIFRDVFDDESLVLTNETNAETIEDWDSLSHIRLIVAIEKHFNIKFTLNELRGLSNVGETAVLISEKLEKRNS